MSDMEVSDMGVCDMGVCDMGVSDMGVSDMGVSDMGVSDMEVSDMGVSDMGVSDMGVVKKKALSWEVWSFMCPRIKHLGNKYKDNQLVRRSGQHFCPLRFTINLIMGEIFTDILIEEFTPCTGHLLSKHCTYY